MEKDKSNLESDFYCITFNGNLGKKAKFKVSVSLSKLLKCFQTIQSLGLVIL